jgi:SAM-dependent methyltransferase
MNLDGVKGKFCLASQDAQKSGRNGTLGALAVQAIMHQKSGAVLDIGCGSGWLADYMPEHVQYEGIDTWKEGIEKAKARYPGSRMHFFTCGDVAKLFPYAYHSLRHDNVSVMLVECGMNTDPEIVGAKNKPHRLFMQHAKKGDAVMLETPTYYSLNRFYELTAEYKAAGFSQYYTERLTFPGIACPERIISILTR